MQAMTPPSGMPACVASWGSPHTPKGSFVALYVCVFLHIDIFLLFRPRVFSRALGSGARREPAETPRRTFEPWPRSVARTLGLQCRISPREGIPSTQSHPCLCKPTYTLNKCPTAHVISILNVVDVIRHFLAVEILLPRHQLARHASTVSTIRCNLHDFGMKVSSHARPRVEDMTTLWLGIHVQPTA